MKPKNIKKGMRVNYHSIIGGPATIEGATVREEPFRMASGEWVCMITGKSGYVSVAALSPYEAKYTRSFKMKKVTLRDGELEVFKYTFRQIGLSRRLNEDSGFFEVRLRFSREQIETIDGIAEGLKNEQTNENGGH
jgi:hypothetical protein